MSKIWVGPTGSVVKGHVLDVAKPAFERALQDYDKLLYVKWNPKKLRGMGCWEIRRRPAQKEVVDFVSWNGNAYIKIDYMEYDLVNHILDCAFLNYDQIRKIQSMDMWNTHGHASFNDYLEAKERDHVAKVRQKAKEEQDYRAKQMKSLIRQLKSEILSGFNPNDISRFWEK